MIRWFVVASLVSLTASAQTSTAKWNAFREKANAERKKLGLDKNPAALTAKYPTPEVTFQALTMVCPGESKTVKLEGKVPAGAMVMVEDETVELVKEAPSTKGWEGTFKVKPTAVPHTVTATVYAPVSMAGISGPVLRVGCKFTFVIEVAGTTLTLKADFPQGEEQVVSTGEWKKDGKAVGTTTYQVESSASGITLTVQDTPESMQRQLAAAQELLQSPASLALNKRMDTALKKLEPCSKLAPEKMMACMEAPQAELKKLSEEREKLTQDYERKNSVAFGCYRMSLTAKDGKLEGDGERCAGKTSNERVDVKGTYTSP